MTKIKVQVKIGGNPPPRKSALLIVDHHITPDDTHHDAKVYELKQEDSGFSRELDIKEQKVAFAYRLTGRPGADWDVLVEINGKPEYWTNGTLRRPTLYSRWYMVVNGDIHEE